MLFRVLADSNNFDTFLLIFSLIFPRNFVFLARISRKRVNYIFAQILQSNQHLVREAKEQNLISIGVAHKRRLQP